MAFSFAHLTYQIDDLVTTLGKLKKQLAAKTSKKDLGKS